MVCQIHIVLIIRHSQFHIQTPFLISPSGGKGLLPPLGEGREGGNKCNFVKLDLFMITDSHIILLFL